GGDLPRDEGRVRRGAVARAARRQAMNAALALLALLGAPRLPYGSELVSPDGAGGAAHDPAAARNLAELSAAAAVGEPLYRVESSGLVTPELAAELPEISGDRALIRLRPNVLLHDGRRLGAEDVAKAIALWTERGSPQSHRALLIAGGRGHLAGGGPA